MALASFTSIEFFLGLTINEMTEYYELIAENVMSKIHAANG